MTTETLIVCVHCRRPVSARFEITRFDASNASRGTVTACSTLCLIKWAYEYSTLQGMRFAFGAKNAVTALLDSIRGEKK